MAEKASAPAAPKEAPQDVPVRGPDGEIQLYSPTQVQQAIEAGGEVATPQEVKQQKLQEKFGGLGGQAATFAAGVGSGATFGVSSTAIRGMGGGEWLKNHAEANPNAYEAGEYTGIAGSLLLPGLGEAGLAGKGLEGATALPRLVSRAGSAVESGIGRALTSEGAGLAERAAVKGLSSAAGGAIEGAAYGAGHEISDAAIHDHDLVAEKVLAAAGHGALWGGAIGGGLGAGGEFLTSAVKKTAEKISEKVASSSLAEVLERKSGEFAFRSAGGGKALAKSADKFGEGYAEVGKVWRDEAPGFAGKKSFSDMSREDLRAASSKGMKDYGSKLSSDLESMTKHAEKNGTLPNAMDVVGSVRDVAREVGGRAGAGPAVSKLNTFADDLERITGIKDAAGNLVEGAGSKTLTYEQLRNFRVDADAMWKGAAKDPTMTGTAKYFGNVRDALEKQVLDGAEAAGVAKSYAQAKSKYQAFTLLNRATEGGVAAQGSNMFMSLTDRLAGHAGAVAGSMVGGPVGGFIGGAASAAAGKLVRERGDFLAADLLHRVSTLGSVERAAASVDQKITSGVREFLIGSLETKGDRRANVRDYASTLAQSEQIKAAASNPVLLERRFSKFSGQLAQVAPSISGAMAFKLANAHAFLATKMPNPRGNDFSITPQFTKRRASDSEIASAFRFLDGMERPLSILDDMKHGQASREKIEAVKVGYPGIFQQIQQEFAEQSHVLKKELSYQKNLQMQILLGVPTDPSMEPAFISSIQEMKAAKEPAPDSGEQAPDQKLGGRRPIELNTDIYQTGADTAD